MVTARKRIHMRHILKFMLFKKLNETNVRVWVAHLRFISKKKHFYGLSKMSVRWRFAFFVFFAVAQLVCICVRVCWPMCFMYRVPFHFQPAARRPHSFQRNNIIKFMFWNNLISWLHSECICRTSMSVQRTLTCVCAMCVCVIDVTQFRHTISFAIIYHILQWQLDDSMSCHLDHFYCR